MLLPILPHLICRESELKVLSDEQLEQIFLFREKVEELATAQEKYQNIPISTYNKEENNSITDFSANTPEEDSIINLAVRYRFFYASKEATEFGKMINLIRQKSKDEWAINYLDSISRLYKDTMKATDISGKLDYPITNREIINLWFNSQFFHSDKEKRKNLKEMKNNIGKEASIFQLYLAIVKCSSYIQQLYFVVHRVSEKNQIICTPNYHFRTET